MRLTRLGGGAAAMTLLTLLAAASTGNNLLYLLYGASAAALALSVLAGRWNLSGLRVALEPTQAFRGRDFPLTVRVDNPTRWPARGAAVAWGGRRARLGAIAPGARAAARLSCLAPRRGKNRLEGLALESEFPFGLVRHRVPLENAVVTALPATSPARTAAELSADASASGRPGVRRGRGEELFGVRAYDPADESRVINWKLSARTGRLLVNEYCEAGPSHVIIRAPGGRGEAAERAIEAAATAVRFYSDQGASVELVTPDERIGPSRGLRHLDRMLEALALMGEGAVEKPAQAPYEPDAPEQDDDALRGLTFFGLALSFASTFLIDEINPRVLWLLLPVLPLGWWVQKRGKSLLPEFVWRLLSLGALLYLVAFDWRLSGVTVANAHLLLYLLANRALHPLSRKDLPQTFLIEFLAFFLASGLTISLWYFAFFLAYVAFAAAWLLTASRPGRLRRAQTASLVASLALAALPITALVFMATPRVEGLRRINPFLAAGIDKLSVAPSQTTGYTENVTLGYYGLLKKSSARVLQLRPLAAAAQHPASVYVRGAAYDVFSDRRWGRAPGEFTFRLKGRRYPSRSGAAWAIRRDKDRLLPARLSGRAAAYDVMIYPMGLNVVFTVGTPWKLETEEEVSFDHTGTLRFAQPYNARGARYKAHGTEEGGGLSLDLPPSQRAAALSPVSADPRLVALAAKMTAGARSDVDKVAAVEARLRSGWRYSLFGDEMGRSLEDFLFKTKRGNCEFFASAGVALLRASGVPARLATGFLATDWNEYGKFYDVRQSEAHAWVEAFIAGKGWVIVDPTPGQGAFSAAVDTLGHKLSRWADAMQVEWYRHVIGYDQYVQGNTFRRLSLAFSPQALGKALGAAAKALAVAAICAALGFLWRLRKLRAARRAPSFWERAERLLLAAGLERAPWLTPREFAAGLAALGEPALAGLPRLAELHYAQAYERRALSAEESAAAAAILRALLERA